MEDVPGVVSETTAVRVSDGASGVVLDAALEAASAVPVVSVGSPGTAGLEPLVLATHDGRTAFYSNCTPEQARAVIEAAEDGELPEESGAHEARAAHTVVEHDPDTRTLPVPESGPLSVGKRHVLERVGWVDPTSVADYAEFAFERESVTDLSNFGLLGRGRGDGAVDSPITEAWQTARETEGEPVVVVNANEADERNLTDKTLLEGSPADVLDGALAVAGIVGAEDVVVYCNEEEKLAQHRLQETIQSLAEDPDHESPTLPQVVTGPDRYIAGEPTMALESLEGADRLEARLRPPSPAKHGLYGRPTVVHTPRTLAQVRQAILAPERFDADDADPGTRLVTIGGDVEAPATVELPTGGSLSAAREAVEFSEEMKMAVVGGQFGGLARSLDHAPSAPALSGADLGTDGVVELFGESQCAVATAGKRASFAKSENCGRCVPCREGSKQLTDLLRDIYDGEYESGKIRELTRVMETSSTCSFGRDAARTVATAMDEFETEFEAHAEGRCPSGACRSENQ